MNIFYLDNDPAKAAEYHCDKHVVKMILETAQLLSTTHWFFGGSAPYRATHKNHPCSIWARESSQNYQWLHRLGVELCRVYTDRYNKTHATEKVIAILKELPNGIPNTPFTTPALAMPPEYKTNDPVESYRKYYIHGKADIAKWAYSPAPYWWPSGI